MTDMEKVNTLYTMMAERLEQSPFGECQSKVYRDMIEFMRDCGSAEEAMQKIKTSEYYLAPSVALTKDTILAYRAAANEAGMDELVRVYDEKLREIDADGTAIYDASYQERAKRERAAYLSTMEAFLLVFRAWETLRLGDPRDNTALNSTLSDLKKHVAELKKPSAEFTVLAKIPAFRAMVPLSDEWYDRFVSETDAILGGVLPEENVKKITIEAFEEEWKAIEARSSEIEESGREYLKKTKEASVTAEAPEDVNGHYTYTVRKVR